MNWHPYIEQNREIMMGKPVIKDTRITVELILERLGDGWSMDDLLAAYPDLGPIQIQAAIAFSASYLAMDTSIFEPAETE